MPLTEEQVAQVFPGISKKAISQAHQRLVDDGILEKLPTGEYQITEKGVAFCLGMVQQIRSATVRRN